MLAPSGPSRVSDLDCSGPILLQAFEIATHMMSEHRGGSIVFVSR